MSLACFLSYLECQTQFEKMGGVTRKDQGIIKMRNEGGENVHLLTMNLYLYSNI